MLADIIPTGLEVGVQNGEVGLGDTVAIIGAGPVGLATVLAAQFYAPADIIVVDIDDNRLEIARKLGATVVINNSDDRAFEKIMALTDGQGVDVVIEVVGHPSTCALAQAIVGSGGRIANIGVHSRSVELHNEILWTRNITIRMGVVNTNTIPVLLKMVKTGKLKSYTADHAPSPARPDHGCLRHFQTRRRRTSAQDRSHQSRRTPPQINRRCSADSADCCPSIGRFIRERR